MKIDSAMMKQINSAVETTLKKNKDIKAASDVEKNIDKFISKNKISVDNARKIDALEKQVKSLETRLKNAETMMKTLEKIGLHNLERLTKRS